MCHYYERVYPIQSTQRLVQSIANDSCIAKQYKHCWNSSAANLQARGRRVLIFPMEFDHDLSPRLIFATTLKITGK